MRAWTGDWRRDLGLFAAGPGLIAVGSAALFAIHSWPVPTPSQAQILSPLPLVTLLAAGAIGARLSAGVGYPAAPRLPDSRAWMRLAAPALVAGAVFGALLLAADTATGFTSGALAALGMTWVNVALPWSIPHYAAAAILLECAYRLLPIPLLSLALKGLLRGRGATSIFVALTILTSLLEPLGLLPLARPGAAGALLLLMGVAFAANLFEAMEFRRRGWPAPIIFRLSFYAVWHVFGPYILAKSSVLYPGPH